MGGGQWPLGSSVASFGPREPLATHHAPACSWTPLSHLSAAQACGVTALGSTDDSSAGLRSPLPRPSPLWQRPQRVRGRSGDRPGWRAGLCRRAGRQPGPSCLPGGQQHLDRCKEGRHQAFLFHGGRTPVVDQQAFLWGVSSSACLGGALPTCLGVRVSDGAQTQPHTPGGA